MKGEILYFNENEGVIVGEDGKRYSFSLQDWREKELPTKGDSVDFSISENTAREIYLIGQKSINKGWIGGVGAILLFFTWLPYLGLILGIIGIFMLTIAIKNISDLSPEKGIFKNWIIAIILYIVEYILLSVLGSSLILFSISSATNPEGILGNLSLSIIVILVITYIGAIIEGILLKKVFYNIYSLNGEKLFKIAGNMFFWGGILSIVFIGMLLNFIGWILTAIAFFSKKVK